MTRRRDKSERNRLLLWRWNEAESSVGYIPSSSYSSQLRTARPGETLFIAATRDNRLYLLGALIARRIAKVRNYDASIHMGRYQAHGESISGPFGIFPLNELTWRLRFENSVSDRLNRSIRISSQLQAHRYLTAESAKRLVGFLRRQLPNIESRRTEESLLKAKNGSGRRYLLFAIRNCVQRLKNIGV